MLPFRNLLRPPHGLSIFLTANSFIPRRIPWILPVLSLFIITGCITVGPDYKRPSTALSKEWRTNLEGGLKAGEVDVKTLSAWWNAFNDSKLSSLIDRAISGNLDLRQAKARVREARARRGVAQAGLFPTLQADGSATRSKSREDTGTGKVSETRDLYSAGFDTNWEIDIFGGVRRSVEAAEADFEASREDVRDVLVTLIAEVALNYIDLRTMQSRIDVAENNLQTQSETCQLVLWQYQAGLSDGLAYQQATYNLETTRAQLPTLRTGREEAINRIAVLLGEQPGEVHQELQQQESIPTASLEVAVGVPADVLRHRPDVRRTERELAAQSARIGVATADLYPKFTLNGSIGLETLSLPGMPSTHTNAMTGGPQVSWAIFKGGAIRQNIEIQTALQEQARISYEATILTALEEVENALTACAEEQLRKKHLQEATRAAVNAVELSQYKYQAGLTDFSNVLISERSLLSLQDQLAQSSGTVAANLVGLYKALGGGWETLEFDDRQ